MENITKWKGDASAKEMIINMEFGAFDKERAILPLTMFDNKMDRKSVVSEPPRFVPLTLDVPMTSFFSYLHSVCVIPVPQTSSGDT
jgi:hypothetical protein